METKVLIRIIVQLSHAETVRKGVDSIADAFAFNLTLTLSLIALGMGEVKVTSSPRSTLD